MSEKKNRLRKLCHSIRSDGKIEEEELFGSQGCGYPNDVTHQNIILSPQNYSNAESCGIETFHEDHTKRFDRKDKNLSDLKNNEHNPRLNQTRIAKSTDSSYKEEKKSSNIIQKNSTESKNTEPSESFVDEVDSAFQNVCDSEISFERNKFKRLKKVLGNRLQEEDILNNQIQNPINEEAKHRSQDCSICLSEINSIVAKLDCCSHVFCFDCIKEWSNVANECPLCKNRFRKITKWSKEGYKIGEARIRQRNQISEEPEFEILESKFFYPFVHLIV